MVLGKRANEKVVVKKTPAAAKQRAFKERENSMRENFNPENEPESTTKRIELVTFRQFAELARRRNLTAQSLAGRFRGRIDKPLEFFTRVLFRKMAGKHHSISIAP